MASLKFKQFREITRDTPTAFRLQRYVTACIRAIQLKSDEHQSVVLSHMKVSMRIIEGRTRPSRSRAQIVSAGIIMAYRQGIVGAELGTASPSALSSSLALSLYKEEVPRDR